MQIIELGLRRLGKFVAEGKQKFPMYAGGWQMKKFENGGSRMSG